LIVSKWANGNNNYLIFQFLLSKLPLNSGKTLIFAVSIFNYLSSSKSASTIFDLSILSDSLLTGVLGG